MPFCVTDRYSSISNGSFIVKTLRIQLSKAYSKLISNVFLRKHRKKSCDSVHGRIRFAKHQKPLISEMIEAEKKVPPISADKKTTFIMLFEATCVDTKKLR